MLALIKNKIYRLYKWKNNIPFRINFFYFIIVLFLAKIYIKPYHEEGEDAIAFKAKIIFDGLLSFIEYTFYSLIAFALITIIIAYYSNKYNKKTKIEVDEYYSPDDITYIKFKISQISKPFLGKIYTALKYHYTFTPLTELNQSKNKLYQASIPFNLPFVKRYEFDHIQIIISDIFSFFQLTKSIPIKFTITKRSQENQKDFELDTVINKSIEAHQRVNKLHKIPGEWLHYKHFEPSDDIRRMVWRIFARTKELIVRQQEIFNPYTSDINFYVSFLGQFDAFFVNDYIKNSLLTQYKNQVWSIYKYFKNTKNIYLQYTPDQKLKNIDVEDYEAYNHEIISSSEWIETPTLMDYISEGGNLILCISPFILISDLEIFLSKNQNAYIIFIVPTIHIKKQKNIWWKRLMYKNNTEVKNSIHDYLMALDKIEQKYKDRISMIENKLNNFNIHFKTIKIEDK